jgi:hypothetical protein
MDNKDHVEMDTTIDTPAHTQFASADAAKLHLLAAHPKMSGTVPGDQGGQFDA